MSISGEVIGQLILWLILAVVVIAIAFWILHRLYRRSTKEIAFVRTGFLGEKVYNTVIPRNVRVSEAPSHGKPVLLYDFRCPGSQAYIQLAREVIKREAAL